MHRMSTAPTTSLEHGEHVERKELQLPPKRQVAGDAALQEDNSNPLSATRLNDAVSQNLSLLAQLMRLKIWYLQIRRTHWMLQNVLPQMGPRKPGLVLIPPTGPL